jgi:hypothetical protein
MCTKHANHFTELVEIRLDAQVSKFDIPDLAVLRNSKVVAIESYRSSDIVITPLARSVASDTVFTRSFLTLNIGGTDCINKIPLRNLNSGLNFGEVNGFNALQVDFPKSYITIPDPTVITVGTSLLLCVSYIPNNFGKNCETNQGQERQGRGIVPGGGSKAGYHTLG